MPSKARTLSRPPRGGRDALTSGNMAVVRIDVIGSLDGTGRPLSHHGKLCPSEKWPSIEVICSSGGEKLGVMTPAEGPARARPRRRKPEWCAASPHECRNDPGGSPTALPRQPPPGSAPLLRSALRLARFGDCGDLVAGQRELASRPVVFQ